MSTQTSAEMAGGTAVGLSGHIHGFNADVEARLDGMMMQVGKWIVDNAGVLLGHVKMSVTNNGKGLTLNVVNYDSGVEHHGVLRPCEKADFNFMAAVVDVDPGKLKHAVLHAIEDSEVDFCLDDHDCGCGHHHGHTHEPEHRH